MPPSAAGLLRTPVDRPLTELVTSGAELRVVADLPGLAAAVAASSSADSCIRICMRNAVD
jgi:hypothetical protein